MEIEKKVIINEAETSNQIVNEIEDQEIYWDVPVTRANAITFFLLQRVYSRNDELNYEDRGELVAFINRFVNQKTFSGTADDFHNFAVELARRDEYSLACDILDAGLKVTEFKRNCDLLADYLQYGINCGRIKEAKKYFKILMCISRKKWTWRGFSFSIYFLRHLLEQGNTDSSIKQSISVVDCSIEENIELEAEEKVMLALIQEFKNYYPHLEEPFQVEAQVYCYLKEEDKALEALKQAEEIIASCPKCALQRADILFKRGEYLEAGKSVRRALDDAVQTQSSVNEGYLHYLLSLCQLANIRKNNEKLTDEVVDIIYSHFNTALVEFENGKQSYKDVIRRNTRSIRAETGIDVEEKYAHLYELVEE